MISEAIILAGGLGTRLRSSVPDLPKCMAPVARKPFLSYVIEYYLQQGISRFIFSLGYKHEVILEFLHSSFSTLDFAASIEKEPLGTGGAVLKAMSYSNSPNVLVLNGDTIFEVDLQQLSSFHSQKWSDCTLCLKPMTNSDRYGVVETDSQNKVVSFKEKKWYAQSNINGGVYAINKNSFDKILLPEKFSFEKDYLEKYYTTHNFYGLIQDKYFIDIGIPEDFNRAQTELKKDSHN